MTDPWGKVAAKAGHGEEIVYADINLDYMAEVRQQIPITVQVSTLQVRCQDQVRYGTAFDPQPSKWCPSTSLSSLPVMTRVPETPLVNSIEPISQIYLDRGYVLLMAPTHSFSLSKPTRPRSHCPRAPSSSVQFDGPYNRKSDHISEIFY